MVWLINKLVPIRTKLCGLANVSHEPNTDIALLQKKFSFSQFNEVASFYHQIPTLILPNLITTIWFDKLLGVMINVIPA